MSAAFTPSDADHRRDAETAELFRKAAALDGRDRDERLDVLAGLAERGERGERAAHRQASVAQSTIVGRDAA